MTKKKKIILSAGVSLIIIVSSGFAVVMSSTACGFSPTHRGPRFHRPGVPPFMHQEIGKFILWRLDQGVKDLELTKGQQKEYDQLKAALQNTMEKGIQTRGQIKTLTRSQMEKQAPDISVVAQTFQTHLNSMTTLLNNNLTLFQTFYTSLDADQKKQISQKIKERYDRHKKAYSCDDQ